MIVLILGLVLFLGMHSVRIVADDWRGTQRARRGEAAWTGIYTVVSLTGFALIVWGYGLAREAPIALWSPPLWTRHLAALLTLVAFLFLAAAYVPGTAIKRAVGHPMVLGTAVWAFAHLIANGTLADGLLFGSFLMWAVANFSAARRRDRVARVTYPTGGVSRDLAAVLVGIVMWAAFAFYLHAVVIGVHPFG